MLPLTELLSQFANITEDLRDELEMGFSARRILKRNDFFVKEGKHCDEIAFIEDGMIRHFYNSDKGEVTRWVSLGNSLCTSLASFIKRTQSLENLQAIVETRIIVISRVEFMRLYQKYPTVREIWSKLMEINYLGMEERVFQLIALDAEERYRLLASNYPEFIVKVPNKYIASMLGIDARHLSRIRAKK